jgi:hypothetical protein
MVKIMLAKTILIDRVIIRHAQNDHSFDRLLETFQLLRGNLWSVRKKNSASELKFGKIFFFLISEMEGWWIHNRKNISEALHNVLLSTRDGATSLTK